MTHAQWIELTPVQQRIKVAELCEWTDVRVAISWGGVPGVIGTCPPEYRSPLVWQYHGNPYNNLTPDYLNDLNAMHEAEETLDRDMLGEYLAYLMKAQGETVISWRLPFATAAQRAEAFVLTLEPETP